MGKEVSKIRARNRSRTPESFRKEMKEKNPNIEIVGDYTKAQEKVECICKICGHNWHPVADSILHGCGCPKCANKNNIAHQSKSTDDYKMEVQKKFPSIQVMDEYVNAHTKIHYKCSICNNEWMTTPTNLSYSKGCPACTRRAFVKNRSKTNEQFLKEVKNDTYDIMEPYVNSSTALLCRCKICGNEWRTTPPNLLNGTKCKLCGYNRKSNDQFVRELSDINNNILPLEKYVKSSQKIKVQCKICNHIWAAVPDGLLRGHGCPECARLQRVLNLSEINQRLKNNSSSIQIIGDYINTTTPVDVECQVCKYQWKSYGSYLVLGIGCPNCAKIKQRKTHQRYIDELKEKSLKVIPLEEYCGSTNKILHQCTICNYQWSVEPTNILAGHGCPKCAKIKTGLKRRISQSEFDKRLAEIHHGFILAMDDYNGMNEEIQFFCYICQNSWKAKPQYIVGRGHGCPVCASSNMERDTVYFLNQRRILYKHQVTFEDLIGFGGGFLSYDFYIPSYNLFIECQGIQHFEPVEYFGGEEKFKTQQEHDKLKRNYAKNHQANLLEIRYDEDLVACLDSYFSTNTPIKKYTKISPKYRIK